MGFSAVGIVETKLWRNREDDGDGTDSHLHASRMVKAVDDGASVAEVARRLTFRRRPCGTLRSIRVYCGWRLSPPQ